MDVVILLDDTCTIYHRYYRFNAIDILQFRDVGGIRLDRPGSVQDIQIRRSELDIAGYSGKFISDFPSESRRNGNGDYHHKITYRNGSHCD